jgi:hypothetical protein
MPLALRQRDTLPKSNSRHFLTLNACSILRREHIDVLFVDPGIEAPPATLTIARILEEFPSVAVVVYGPIQPVTIMAVHELSKRGLFRVVLQNYEDDPSQIRILLDSVLPRQLLPLVFFVPARR